MYVSSALGMRVKCGSCWPHVKINFYEGGVVGGTNATPETSSDPVQQTRCPTFFYADITKGRRVSPPNQ